MTVPLTKPADLTPGAALRAYAAMVNTLDPSRLAPYLADNFHYASQAVFAEIESKSEYLAYIHSKFETLREMAPGYVVRAQIGRFAHALDDETGDRCVIVEQDGKVVANVLVRVADGLIKRLDMCTVAPAPGSAIPMGDYPV